MSEPIVVTHLLPKKADVEAQIASLSERLALARADHDAVVAAVRLFDPTFADRPASAYHSVTRRMKRSAAFALCRAALHSSPDPWTPGNWSCTSSGLRSGTRTTTASASP